MSTKTKKNRLAGITEEDYEYTVDETNRKDNINSAVFSDYYIEAIPDATQVVLTNNIIDKIDLTDKTYILREIDLEKMYEDKEIIALAYSIYSVGLMNPVFIQERNDGKYRIISGLRRILAIKSGIRSNGSQYTYKANVVIVPSKYKKEDLDILQVNENTHRENLKPLELAQKVYEESNNFKISIDEIAKKFNFSPRHALRLKSLLSYPKPLKEITNKVGLSLVEAINKIIKYKGLDEEKDIDEIKKIVNELKNKTRDEINQYLKELKAKNSNQNIETKSFKNYHLLKINKSLTNKQIEEICKFINKTIGS